MLAEYYFVTTGLWYVYCAWANVHMNTINNRQQRAISTYYPGLLVLAAVCLSRDNRASEIGKLPLFSCVTWCGCRVTSLILTCDVVWHMQLNYSVCFVDAAAFQAR